MGIRVTLTNFLRAGTGQRMAVFSCRCKRNHAVVPLTGDLAGGHLLSVVGCPCLPPLDAVLQPEELQGFLASMTQEDWLDMASMLPPEKESPRQEPTDEGLVRSREEVTDKKNDSSADIAPQSRFLGEGNELVCALHGQACAGHKPPTGDAA